MEDRNVQFPQRYQLKKVEGTEDIFDLIPAPGEVSAEGTLINKATLLKDVTAALFGLGVEAVPDDVLALLSKAVLYKTITPTAQLGTLPEGSIIYLNENGSSVPFYVAKQGYEPSYNTDRVLVVRKDMVQTGPWNDSGVNKYEGSTIDAWMTKTYFSMLSGTIQNAIGFTNIPYTPMGDVTTVQRINKSVFALSITELGISESGTNIEGNSLPIASTLYPLPSGTDRQYTRSPNPTNSTFAWSLNNLGVAGSNTCSISYGYRPAFTLPASFTAYNPEMYPSGGLYDLSDNLLLKLPGVQIETGSYTGTGTYGSSNPNSLTFGFVPKVLFFIANTEVSPAQINSYGLTAKIPIYALSSDYSPVSMQNVGNSGYYNPMKISGTTVTWYYNNNSASYQLNTSGITYYYLAIG